MKTIKLLILFVLVTTISCAQKKSPRQQAEGVINGVTVNIDYGAPSVKGRKIWGGLVPYGQTWRAGANENTTISFDKDVTVNGKNLGAGKYGFFIIPNENGDWTVIFSNKNDAWGAFSYKEEEDVLRVNSTPEYVANNQELLQYSVGKNSIDISWEKARLSLYITAK